MKIPLAYTLVGRIRFRNIKMLKEESDAFDLPTGYRIVRRTEGFDQLNDKIGSSGKGRSMSVV